MIRRGFDPKTLPSVLEEKHSGLHDPVVQSIPLEHMPQRKSEAALIACKRFRVSMEMLFARGIKSAIMVICWPSVSGTP